VALSLLAGGEREKERERKRERERERERKGEGEREGERSSPPFYSAEEVTTCLLSSFLEGDIRPRVVATEIFILMRRKRLSFRESILQT